MRMNFSRRRRTSLSGLSRRSSSSCLHSVSRTALAVVSWSACPPPGGAHANHEVTATAVRDALVRHVDELRRLKPDKLVRRRREKFLRMGQYLE